MKKEKTETILVLMSVYNGKEYLEEQIISILNQENLNVKLLIRDDGSTDDSLSVINKFLKNYSNIEIICGENVGPCGSFFELVQLSTSDYDLYAFSDQDDFWLPNKLSIASQMLKESGKMLYCSNTIITDSNLCIKRINKKNYVPSFGNSLIQNISPGCTFVFTKKLRDIFLKGKYGNIYMHDWYFYMIAAYYNSVVFDNDSYILYRQHKNNVLGNKNYCTRVRNAISNNNKTKNIILEQIKSFSIHIGEDKVLRWINNLTLKNKLNILFSRKIVRQNLLETIIYKIIIVFLW